jgi:hypothetical protein
MPDAQLLLLFVLPRRGPTNALQRSLARRDRAAGLLSMVLGLKPALAENPTR